MKKEIAYCVLLAAVSGCRILETGYGDDNAAVRAAADAVSETTAAAKSALVWTGENALSFADDLSGEKHEAFILAGEHAAAAYRGGILPDGYVPFTSSEVQSLSLPSGRFSYDESTGFLEVTDGSGFAARLSRRGGERVVAFRGSNAPGEDEHWMQDWEADAKQGGGATPTQYVDGADVLARVRRAFPGDRITTVGHSLGGGIAAYAMIVSEKLENVQCATFNAAGISAVTLMAMPADAVGRAGEKISNIRSKGDPVSAIPGTSLVGKIYEVDNLRFANHAIGGLLTDMRRRAQGRRAGWLRDLFDE